jgi:hypothetical protein
MQTLDKNLSALIVLLSKINRIASDAIRYLQMFMPHRMQVSNANDRKV